MKKTSFIIFSIFIALFIVADIAGSTPLAFLCWDSSNLNKPPNYVPRGNTPELQDGDLLELASSGNDFVNNNNLAWSDVIFTTIMEKNGEKIAEHSFKMPNMTGNNIWVFADPRRTPPNDSFTDAFIKAILEQGAGKHELHIKVFAEGGGKREMINDGKIICNTTGDSSQYKALLPYLADLAGTWDATVRAYSEEQDAKFEEEERLQAERSKADLFTINIKNNDTGYTKYIITKDKRTLSEKITEVLPGRTLSLDLFRNMEYDILYYCQNWSKDNARLIATVTSNDHNNTFNIN